MMKGEDFQEGRDQLCHILLTRLGSDHGIEQHEGHCNLDAKFFSSYSRFKREPRARTRDTKWRKLFDLLTICYYTKWVAKDITREKPSLSSGYNCFLKPWRVKVTCDYNLSGKWLLRKFILSFECFSFLTNALWTTAQGDLMKTPPTVNWSFVYIEYNYKCWLAWLVLSGIPQTEQFRLITFSPLTFYHKFFDSFTECLVTALAPSLAMWWPSFWKKIGSLGRGDGQEGWNHCFASVSALLERTFTARESIFLELACSFSMLWTFILKPTIFSEGLIIQVGKLVESHHLSLLACRNSPMKLRMVISATPGEGSRQEKFRFWSSMWGAAKVSQGLPTPVLAPCPFPRWDLPPAKPSLDRSWWCWVSA